jgi:thiol-disulfide isomerase/thioredoxin
MRSISLAAAVACALFTTACTDQKAQQRLDDLEARVKAIEEKGAKPAGAPGEAKPADPNEELAMGLYKEAAELAAANKPDEAKAKLEECKKYNTTRAFQACQRLGTELAIVGKDVVGGIQADEWYQGKANASAKATLLVFWEVWCPHCKREVPKLEETFKKFGGQGLDVIGLTSLSRNKTPDEVKAFMKENNVSYPMGKASEATWSFYGVGGVPAAAVVKGGKVVWRGHPAAIKDEMITGWIN